MKLSTMLDYSRGVKDSLDAAVELEQAGLDIVWVAEAYGYDGVSQMGYLAARTTTMEIGSAILPIYSRTPTLLAQTAAGLDAVSGGRFILGLGASGPQVIEGWHGVPYTRAARTDPGDHRHLPEGVAAGGPDQRGDLPHPAARPGRGRVWASR